MRIMALWFPDWPVQAVRLNGDVKDLDHPVAVAAQYRIRVCGHSARAQGVRRGMRVRQAQAICPELKVVDADVERDARMFEDIVASLDDVASTIEVLRPGLVAVEAGAAARYHGSEDKAAQMLIDAAARRGVDVVTGIADEVTTAVIAARAGAVVEPGASVGFLENQPLRVLAAEEALDCDGEVLAALSDLGLTRLGELAALPAGAVSTRFGAAGERCHRIAQGVLDRGVAAGVDKHDLEVAHIPEDPITRVDAAAFVARSLAAQLHDSLKQRGLVCHLLNVTAELTDGTTLKRTWRTCGPLTEASTADRVRWQLDGWLTSRGASVDEEAEGGISLLSLLPLECTAPDIAADGLWDTGTGHHATARQVIERVQSQLGTDAVLTPVPAGGRGVAERITFVPYGEVRDPVRNPTGTWPGRIPPPLPARLGGGPNHPAAQVMLIDASGTPVIVTAEVALSHTPHALGWGTHRYLVTGWAGPWPVDERWWESFGKRYARLQVVGRAVDDERPAAWLLVWLNGRWRVEATY